MKKTLFEFYLSLNYTFVVTTEQRLMAAGPASPIAPPDYALQQVAFHLGFKGAFYNYDDQILLNIDHLPTPLLILVKKFFYWYIRENLLPN